MKTKLHYVLSIAMLLTVFSSFAQKNFFEKISSKSNSYQKSITDPTEAIYEFNYAVLSQALSQISEKASDKKNANVLISFPNINGEAVNYTIAEASVMHPDLQAKYPEIRSYIGYSVDSSSSIIRFSLSPYKGLTGIVLGENKTLTYNALENNPNQITVQNKSDLFKDKGFNCKTISSFFKETEKSSGVKDADDSQKRTYKLALSVSGEYATFHGGTLASVNAAIVATLTNINAVFENDFNATMQLVGANDSVLYLDSSTDPYSSLGNYNSELANTLDTVIFEANYDIGHLIAGINDSEGNATGNAACIGCVCNNGGSVGTNHKGSGFSTGSSPIGFNFDIDFVAHEIGHQFGGNHTWTYDGSEGADVQMEPGSGSTIMGYGGITGSTNVQSHSDPYFHAISIEQITNYIKSTSCATVTSTGNTTPTVNAGSDLTLPIGTAFKLVGVGNDTDGDIITYCWEQINEDNAITTYPNPNLTNSNSVLFRSFSPTTNNTRYFPNLLDLNFGVNSTQWEKTPTVGRTADFRLTVRDNKAGGANNAHDDMQITFDASYGPFEITSQNTPDILWTSGTSETITWNVNNTNGLSGATHVNILLSTNGGEDYSTVVNNIPNNGSYTLTVPNTPAPYCRIMIEPTNNNFFAINSETFALDYTINTTCTQYDSASSLGIIISDDTDSFTQSHVINITDATTISDINIGVDISHPYIGDLELAILSPSSTQILLKHHLDCAEEDNIIGTFDDEALSFNCSNSGANIASKSLRELLDGFNGENALGNWTIRLGDFGAGDVGSLNSWFVEICETTETLLSIDEFGFENFEVYPNPNKGEFTIKLNAALSSKVKLEIIDLRGRVIYKNVFNEGGDFEETLILKNVESGMYILNISDELRRSTKKIIIE